MVKTQDGNEFVDLSGTSKASSGNPYDDLIEASQNDPRQIQQRYDKHRVARNEQQKAKLLSPDFTGFIIDPVLAKLLDKASNPEYVDPRNCLVFWGRPPRRIRDLVDVIQQRLLKTAPGLWIMPPENLHLTAIEMVHSRTPVEITQLVETMRPKIPDICRYALDHPVRLVKPMLAYDGAAIALTFLPAAGEQAPPGLEHQDKYTYHHLRRDLYDLCQKAGAEIASRYVLPSAHLTIARFVNQDLHRDGKIPALIEALEDINDHLRRSLWGDEGHSGAVTAQWVVGEEKTLDCRTMTVWYGGGQSEFVSKGMTSISEDPYTF